MDKDTMATVVDITKRAGYGLGPTLARMTDTERELERSIRDHPAGRRLKR